jgi:hypothetical protein
MTSTRSTVCLLLGLAGGLVAHGNAATIESLGDGSAVTRTDRAATFDLLTRYNTVNLDTYAEQSLKITTASTSWGEDPALALMDPFHGTNHGDKAFYATANGSDTWVTIRTTDARPIFGLEFNYANTWTTGDVYGPYPWGDAAALLEWQSWKGGALVSAGSFQNFGLPMGTRVGFYDALGFDRLLVRATVGDPKLQAIALDNLAVQLTALPAPVPELATTSLYGMGLSLLGLCALRAGGTRAVLGPLRRTPRSSWSAGRRPTCPWSSTAGGFHPQPGTQDASRLRRRRAPLPVCRLGLVDDVLAVLVAERSCLAQRQPARGAFPQAQADCKFQGADPRRQGGIGLTDGVICATTAQRQRDVDPIAQRDSSGEGFATIAPVLRDPGT